MSNVVTVVMLLFLLTMSEHDGYMYTLFKEGVYLGILSYPLQILGGGDRAWYRFIEIIFNQSPSPCLNVVVST